MLRIVAAEVLDECRYLALKLDVKGSNHVQAATVRLPGYNPVNICIVVLVNLQPML